MYYPLITRYNSLLLGCLQFLESLKIHVITSSLNFLPVITDIF